MGLVPVEMPLAQTFAPTRAVRRFVASKIVQYAYAVTYRAG